MMDEREDRLDELIRDAARDYNAPPATPRAEMWAAIRAGRPARHSDVRPLAPRQPARSPLRLVIGIAALLALGIAIGRITVPGAGPEPEGQSALAATPNAAPGATPETAAPAGAAARPDAVTPPESRGQQSAAARYATDEHLAQVETFLTEFRTRPAAGEYTAQAQDLLTDTRLLLDSKRVADPRIRQLLEDLELVLAQIATLSRDRGQDLDLIAEALSQSHLRTRLRSAIPTGPAIRS